MWAWAGRITAVAVIGFLLGCRPTEGRRQVQQMAPSASFLKEASAWTFDITYEATVPRVPEGTNELRVWIPVPRDSQVQTITNLRFDRDVQIKEEPKYGNRMAYLSIQNPASELALTMTFRCVRREQITDLTALNPDGRDPAGAHKVFLGSSRLVPQSERIRKLAGEVTEGRKETLHKARAIYDHVVRQMKYDKATPGWGTGDSERACDVGKGNCTDFHSLFNALCRAEEIAAGFQIGLYLPYDGNEKAKLGGYHCWAAFRVPGKTWVPVDASEASKMSDRMEYFFGSHTPNRVTLSTGRDLILEPAQAGGPVNYFLQPHAEADGREVETGKTWSFRMIRE